MTKPMNKIEKLIVELCPEGVEFKELGEVCEIANSGRKPIRADLRTSGNTPYYGANNIQDYVDGFTHDGEFILIAEDGSASLENYSIQFTSGKFWANNHVHVIKGLDNLNNRFLFHYLKNMNFVPYLSGGTRAKLTRGKLTTIKIPIPPLKIQEEIVDILDKFTQLEVELEAELEARKKQYEYYRDEMLSFGEDEVEWKELGEIGDVAMCKRIFKSQTSTNGEIPFYTIGTFGKQATSFISKEIYEDYKKRFYFPNKGDILISASGTIGRLVIYNGEDAYFQDSNIIWLKNDESKVENKFLYYLYTITNWQTEGGTIKRLYNKNFKKVKIPIPPLSKQKEIVKVLDKFDALVNDISVGLPAEIKARRQQYEYYRNKLLTFKEKNSGEDKDENPSKKYIPENTAPIVPMGVPSEYKGSSKSLKFSKKAKSVIKHGIVAIMPNGVITYKYI